MNAMGITYLDTFFSREEGRGNESLHFHELVHVLQWQLLGPKHSSPLTPMAWNGTAIVEVA